MSLTEAFTPRIGGRRFPSMPPWARATGAPSSGRMSSVDEEGVFEEVDLGDGERSTTPRGPARRQSFPVRRSSRTLRRSSAGCRRRRCRRDAHRPCPTPCLGVVTADAAPINLQVGPPMARRPTAPRASVMPSLRERDELEKTEKSGAARYVLRRAVCAAFLSAVIILTIAHSGRHDLLRRSAVQGEASSEYAVQRALSSEAGGRRRSPPRTRRTRRCRQGDDGARPE